jgi:hypothetical protein
MDFEGSFGQDFHFRFTSAVQKRIYARLQLIGPGPASFYCDACRLMAFEPPLMSTTHIVSHLLREIESAVRAVILAASGKTTNSKSQSKHRESVELVLQFLDIPISSSVGRLWLSLPDENYGLHARAHRDALAYRPTNSEFINFWESMEKILDVVLQSFEEKYLSAHQLIEKLLTITTPTEDDIKNLRNNVPNSPTALRVFFNSVNETWLELLKPYFFKLPPGINPLDNTFTLWPESQFLVRASKSNPETVLEIVLQIPDTNNPYVLDDLCDVALELPIKMAVQLIPKMKGWLASHYQRLLPIKIGEFIKRLAENQNIIEALELSQELLAILPDPEITSTGWQRLRSKYEPFVYREILEEYISVLAEIEPMDFVVMLTSIPPQM